MAQIVEIKTVRGAEMMLHGKLGNRIFQVFLIRPKLPKITPKLLEKKNC